MSEEIKRIAQLRTYELETVAAGRSGSGRPAFIPCGDAFEKMSAEISDETLADVVGVGVSVMNKNDE